MNKKSLWKLILILAIPCIIGFMPAPAGLSELAWVLFGHLPGGHCGAGYQAFPGTCRTVNCRCCLHGGGR
ncbi:anion permease [Escherichia coli]